MKVALPPSLVGAARSVIDIFLFCYEHEGEDWTVTAIAKETSHAQPNTSTIMRMLSDSGLIARQGRTIYLGDDLPEETFWINVPQQLAGKSLGLIQAFNWLAREAASSGLPFQLKLQDIGDQFGFSRQQASKRLESLRCIGLIDYSAKRGHGNGITFLSVG